ncbi:hypothetical protein BC829DRAFT_427175, partial [Chytridium lagenaria]
LLCGHCVSFILFGSVYLFFHYWFDSLTDHKYGVSCIFKAHVYSVAFYPCRFFCKLIVQIFSSINLVHKLCKIFFTNSSTKISHVSP